MTTPTTTEVITRNAEAARRLAQAVALWRDDQGVALTDTSDFIDEIESIVDALDIPLPLVVEDDTEQGYHFEPRRPFEDCDLPCSVECDRMTCDRDED